MRDLTKLQDKLEAKAGMRLARDINALDEEFRNLIRKYSHITTDVFIKIQDQDGKISTPYLIQLFKNEAVRTSIANAFLPNYVDSEISKILEG